MRIASKLALMATVLGGFALQPVGSLAGSSKTEKQSQESIDAAIQKAIDKRQRKAKKRMRLAETNKLKTNHHGE